MARKLNWDSTSRLRMLWILGGVGKKESEVFRRGSWIDCIGLDSICLLLPLYRIVLTPEVDQSPCATIGPQLLEKYVCLGE